jgi:hypothetical protein
MVLVNFLACWSFILHQAEGEKTNNFTFYELQKAVLSLLNANTAQDCPFSTRLNELIAQYVSQGAHCPPKCAEIETLSELCPHRPHLPLLLVHRTPGTSALNTLTFLVCRSNPTCFLPCQSS